MKSAIGLLILLLVSSLILAASALDHWNQVSSGGYYANKDLSLNYLGQLLGVVGSGSLHGTGTQIIGMMMRRINLSMTYVTGGYIGYITLNVLVNSIKQGSIMAANPVMLFFRAALGMALIVPLPSGYNTSQSIVVKVVMQGTYLADWTWDYALTYLQSGGVIFSDISHTTPASSDQYDLLTDSTSGKLNYISLPVSTTMQVFWLG